MKEYLGIADIAFLLSAHFVGWYIGCELFRYIL